MTIVRKRLPLSFDPAALAEDYRSVPRSAFGDVFNPYLEPDTLFRLDLIEPEFVPEMDRTPDFRPNDRLRACPAFLAVFEAIRSPMELMRVHTLAPGASIRPHRDVGRSFEQGIFRIHVPITTGSDVVTLHAGEPVVMGAGECWYLNFDLQHEIHNRSDQWRAHLIMDCRRNDWWDALMTNA
ncbi:MAG: aspartyl/asparaginyl beta-hydroxylase domain-containing protein [Erythrobacter sp.]|nr:aspartyl/asparaginyl beta-hydroxylase domain-containing protein [Erythrobacter sp.]